MKNDISNDSVRDILAVFDDYTVSSNWAQNALAFCYKNDIFPDDTDLINPQNNATRGEIAVRIYNLLKTAKLI
ncbi:MAG: S-layer homology domain-containing protein [Clostridiales bacterium]|nr:MAG: S-layer homology domain-containing protein [Clostridiales bacterium]